MYLAEILAELHSLEDAASILYFMTERRAGAILAAMNAELAARITEVLMGSETDQPLPPADLPPAP